VINHRPKNLTVQSNVHQQDLSASSVADEFHLAFQHQPRGSGRLALAADRLSRLQGPYLGLLQKIVPTELPPDARENRVPPESQLDGLRQSGFSALMFCSRHEMALSDHSRVIVSWA